MATFMLAILTVIHQTLLSPRHCVDIDASLLMLKKNFCKRLGKMGETSLRKGHAILRSAERAARASFFCLETP